MNYMSPNMFEAKYSNYVCPLFVGKINQLDIPVISTEFRLLKLWNACDRPEHKKAGLLAKLIIRS